MSAAQDDELLEDLNDVYDYGHDFNDWEIEFIESIQKWDGNFTPAQRSKILSIIDKYER